MFPGAAPSAPLHHLSLNSRQLHLFSHNPHFAEPVRIHRNLPLLLFLCSLLSPLSFPPKIPLAHYLRFSLSLLYHSSREHLIIPYQLSLFSLPSLIPPNLPSFCRLSASPPAICQPPLFYLFFSFHWPQSSPALCHCQVMLIPKRWEDVVECMWRISPLF